MIRKKLSILEILWKGSNTKILTYDGILQGWLLRLPLRGRVGGEKIRVDALLYIAYGFYIILVKEITN